MPEIKGLLISGITIKNFVNNGLFTEHVNGFAFVDVESVGNKNYGIFPTLSKNGIITHSKASGADDSGIWIETSENVRATHNLVEDNVNGFEISNSDKITLAHNVARNNSVGLASLFSRTSSTTARTPRASSCATTCSRTTTGRTPRALARSSPWSPRAPASSTSARTSHASSATACRATTSPASRSPTTAWWP